jgi:hypothetical protein
MIPTTEYTNIPQYIEGWKDTWVTAQEEIAADTCWFNSLQPAGAILLFLGRKFHR